MHWAFIFPALLRRDVLLALLITGVHQFLHASLVFSLYRAVTVDPGFVPRGSRSNEGGRTCAICLCSKESRVHHCSVCKVPPPLPAALGRGS